MKFKYIGNDDTFCIELLAYNLIPRGEYLKNGQVIEVPDDLERVINSLDISGLFVRVNSKDSVSKKVVNKKEKK